MNEDEPSTQPQPIPQMAQQFIADQLRRRHHAHAEMELIRPSERGVFGDSYVDKLFRSEALIAVLDTNVILKDLAYAVRPGVVQTTLMTAANTRALRFYVAEHVIKEIYDNGQRWCAERKIDAARFWDRWESEYLHVLHMVPDDALSEELLTPAERERIQWLRERNDAKDVPSVILSLVLGAFLVTEDRRAHFAVYGKKYPYDEIKRWRDYLVAGSDSSEAAKVLFETLAMPSIVGYAAYDAARSLITEFPYVAGALAVGFSILSLRLGKNGWTKIWCGVKHTGAFMANMYMPYYDALSYFKAAQPDIPTWEALLDVTMHRALLTRACVYTLGRSSKGVRSATQLADALPVLGVGQGAPLVRDVLRNNPAFLLCGRGRWKLGHYYPLYGQR